MSADRDRVIAWARDSLGSPHTVFVEVNTVTAMDKETIVEIAVLSRNGRVRLDTLVYPDTWTRDTAEQLQERGITENEMAAAPRWDEIAPVVRSHLEGKRVISYHSPQVVQAIVARLPRYTFTAYSMQELFAKFHGQWDPVQQRYEYFTLQEAVRALVPPSLRGESESERAWIKADLCLLLVTEMASQEQSADHRTHSGDARKLETDLDVVLFQFIPVLKAGLRAKAYEHGGLDAALSQLEGGEHLPLAQWGQGALALYAMLKWAKQNGILDMVNHGQPWEMEWGENEPRK